MTETDRRIQLPLADWAAYAGLVWPMIISSLGHLLLSVVDTAIVGRAGTVDIAGVSAAAAVYSVVSQSLGAAIIGYQVIAARRFGAGDHGGVGTAWWHAAALAFPLTLIGLALIWLSPLTSFVSRDESVLAVANAYLWYRGFGLPLFVLTLLLHSTCDASGQTRWGMYAALLSNSFNIVLTYALVFGPGPFPAMGGPGSGLASSISAGIALSFLVAVSIWKQFPGLLSLPSVRWNWEEAAGILRLSVPELLSSLLDYTGTLVFFALAGRLGIVQLAGSRIAFSVLLVLFTISMCFGNGLQILSARALGAGDRHRVPLLLRNDGLLAVLVVGLAGVAMAAFPVPFARLFTNDAELIAQTLGALRVVGLTTPVMIWATCATGILRALKRSKWVMYINVLSVWAIELPVAWVFGLYLGLGAAGLFTGYFAYFVVRAVWTHLLVHHFMVNAEREAKVSIH